MSSLHSTITKLLPAILSSLFAISSVTAQTYEHHVKIDPSDGKAKILEKAARVVPNRPQLLHHLDEYAAFIHFGINTYSGAEWGSGKENPSIFNPGDSLDTDQWCRIMKDAGIKKVVITVKHHDGFCLWQTRYNSTFSVRSIPWRKGKGDVLRELSNSCKKYGLKLGIYISPADLYQMENAKHGIYGNLSKYQKTVIPTDPSSFKTNPTKVRADKPKGSPTFTVEADDYNRYFMNQLYEVLTEYGPIHEVWFDGAHPKHKGGQKYIKPEWFKMIRKLAPEAAIFGGPDTRWCGNESGVTRSSEWSVLPIQDFKTIGIDRPQHDVASDEKITAPKYDVYGKKYKANYLAYLVNEVNTSIRHGWFWKNDTTQNVRTADDTFDIYERSVGGNSLFLLNIPPNNKGLFSKRDEDCLLEVGRRIHETYGTNLAKVDGVQIITEKGIPIKGLLDNNLDTYWQAPSTKGTILIKIPEKKKINRFVLQESITKVGQRIKTHELDAMVNGKWKKVAEATTVGYKKIIRFPAVETDRFRLRILDSRLRPSIANIGLHFYNSPAPSVKVSHEQGKIVLKASRPNHVFSWKHEKARKVIPNDNEDAVIHYTLDGTEPTTSSPKYGEPLAIKGGILKARSFKDGQAGPIVQEWIELPKTGWKVIACSSEQADNWAASKAIDGDTKTFWHTSWSKNTPHPHYITIDLGKTQKMSAITYLPRQDKHIPDGMIESGKVEVSTNGKQWHTAANFKLGNILNDPTRRKILFKKAANARYIRLISLTGVQGKPYAGAAEIGILPAK